ncbi:hypothetical protein ACWCWD_28595 [Streptomyces sp. NPDC001493]
MATTEKKRRAARAGRAGLGAVHETAGIPPLRERSVVSIKNAAGGSS